jgi:hypothetical protein
LNEQKIREDVASRLMQQIESPKLKIRRDVENESNRDDKDCKWIDPEASPDNEREKQ